jgi:hypothetical protein
MMRADTAAQTEYFKGMFGIGAMSPERNPPEEEQEPIEGGDRYYVPLNMVPIDKIDSFLDGKAKPDPNSAAVARGTAGKSAVFPRCDRPRAQSEASRAQKVRRNCVFAACSGGH